MLLAIKMFPAVNPSGCFSLNLPREYGLKSTNVVHVLLAIEAFGTRYLKQPFAQRHTDVDRLGENDLDAPDFGVANRPFQSR